MSQLADVNTQSTVGMFHFYDVLHWFDVLTFQGVCTYHPCKNQTNIVVTQASSAKRIHCLAALRVIA